MTQGSPVVLKEAQAMVFDPEFYPSRSAVLEDSNVVERLKGIEEGRSIGERAGITEYGATRVVIEAELNRAALLVLSDTFYPGWEVDVNNVAAKPLRVDGAFRGVMLDKGKSKVVWSYRPMELYGGGCALRSRYYSFSLFHLLVRAKKKPRRRAGGWTGLKGLKGLKIVRSFVNFN